MSETLLVCQMTYTTNDDGRLGLVFADEVDEHLSRSFVYCLSIPHNWLPRFRHPFEPLEWFELYGFFEAQYSVIFPCSQDNEFVELKSTCSSPEIVFEALNQRFAFVLLVEQIVPRSKSFPYIGWPKRTKYLGQNIEGKERTFVELLPMDIDKMNDVYWKDHFVFVGKTLSFPRRRE